MLSRPLTRSERILPADTDNILDKCGPCGVMLLSQAEHPRLHEHCSLYWHAGQLRRAAQRHCLQMVRSTRVSTRCVAFPALSLSPAAAPPPSDSQALSAGGTPAPRETPSRATAGALSAPLSVGNSTFGDRQASRSGSCSSSGRSPRPSLASSADAMAIPRLCSLANLTRLLSPYEKLLCPSLLYSPLLAPSIAEEDGQFASTRPCGSSAPSHNPAGQQQQRVGCFALARSSRARLAQAMHAAIAAAVPTEEAALFLSLSLVYFDLRVGFQEVTSEGSTEVERAGHESGEDSSPCPAGSSPHAEPSALEWRHMVPAPAVSYQELQDRLRAALDAFSAHATAPGDVRDRTVAERSLHRRRPGSNVTLALLLLAAQEWEERRAETVTAGSPLGCHATPLTPRDLAAANTPPAVVTAVATQPASPVSAPEKAAKRRVKRNGAAASRRRRPRGSPAGKEQGMEEGEGGEGGAGHTSHRPTVLQRQRQRRRRRQREDEDEAANFAPFADHDVPRSAHELRLPALPQDPALIYFLPVWDRVLAQCLASPARLRTLRQLLLHEAGRRCQELVALAHASLSSRLADAARAAPTATNAASAAPAHAGLPSPPPPRRLPVRLLPSLQTDSTSFCFYGPTGDGAWLWSGPLCWRGFVGRVARCGVPGEGRLKSRLDGHAACLEHNAPRIAGAVKAFVDGVPSSSPRASHPQPLSFVLVESSEELADLLNRCGVCLLTPGPVPPTDGPPAAPLPAVPFSPFSAFASHTFRLPVSAAASSAALLSLPSRMLVLPKHVTQFALRVFSRELPAAHACCREAHMQELRLRLHPHASNSGSNAGLGVGDLALTLLSSAGREVRIGAPAQLCAEAFDRLFRSLARKGENSDSSSASSPSSPPRPLDAPAGQQRARMACAAEFTSAASLRLVSEGGLAEAEALLSYILRRPDNVLSALPVRRRLTPRGLDGARFPLHSRADQRCGDAAAPTPPRPAVAAHVTVIQLRRREESVLLRILACHPLATHINGCGVAQLVLDAAQGKLLVQRRCGQVASWQLKDCYTSRGGEGGAGDGGSSLRAPAVCALSPRPMPLPADLAAAAAEARFKTGVAAPLRCSQVERDGFAEMLRRHFTALLAASSAAGRASSSEAGGRGSIYDRLWADNPARGAPVESGDTPPKEKDAIVSPSSPPRPPQMPGALPGNQDTPVNDRADLSGDGAGLYPRRVLLTGLDRSAALFVARHHPGYYTELRGCGLADAYVAAVPERRAAAGWSVPLLTSSDEEGGEEGGRDGSAPSDDDGGEDQQPGGVAVASRIAEVAVPTLPPDGRPQRRQRVESDSEAAILQPRASAVTTSTSPLHSGRASPPSSSMSPLQPSMAATDTVPALVFQLVCGRFVRCEWQECFHAESGILRPCWVLPCNSGTPAR